MKVLELFAGSRSIGKVCDELGHKVFSSDWTPFDGIDYAVDINQFDTSKVPFIPDLFPEYFGDWVCQGGKMIAVGETYRIEGCTYGNSFDHMPTTHWGFRHWMWTICGSVLFIWNVIELLPKSWRNV